MSVFVSSEGTFSKQSIEQTSKVSQRSKEQSRVSRENLHKSDTSMRSEVNKSETGSSNSVVFERQSHPSGVKNVRASMLVTEGGSEASRRGR